VYVSFKLLLIFVVAVLVQAVVNPGPSPIRGPVGCNRRTDSAAIDESNN